jgi:hypothetical protein
MTAFVSFERGYFAASLVKLPRPEGSASVRRCSSAEEQPTGVGRPPRLFGITEGSSELNWRFSQESGRGERI